MGAHGLGPSTIVAPGQKIAGLETQSLLSSWASRGNPGVTDAEGQTQALNTQTEGGKVTALAREDSSPASHCPHPRPFRLLSRILSLWALCLGPCRSETAAWVVL